jgi:hypothetical protein
MPGASELTFVKDSLARALINGGNHDLALHDGAPIVSGR